MTVAYWDMHGLDIWPWYQTSTKISVKVCNDGLRCGISGLVLFIPASNGSKMWHRLQRAASAGGCREDAAVVMPARLDSKPGGLNNQVLKENFLKRIFHSTTAYMRIVRLQNTVFCTAWNKHGIGWIRQKIQCSEELRFEKEILKEIIPLHDSLCAHKCLQQASKWYFGIGS